jgi:hypothetical protein
MAFFLVLPDPPLHVEQRDLSDQRAAVPAGADEPRLVGDPDADARSRRRRL